MATINERLRDEAIAHSGANNGELVSKAARNEVIAIVTQQLDRAMGQSGRITNFVTNRAGR